MEERPRSSALRTTGTDLPVQPPNFDVPTFPPTGNDEIDQALTAWQQSFSQQYRAGQEAVSRTPYIVTTFSGASANNPALGYMSKKVTLLGGEQIVALGFFDFTVKSGMTASSGSIVVPETQVAKGKLGIVYPGGSTYAFPTPQEARFRVQNSIDKTSGSGGGGTFKSTVSISGMVGFSWPIEAKFQTGGDHQFILRTSGDGSITGGQLTIVVL